MGKGGRIVCIFTPYVLTIASLICIIMVGLGCTKSSSSTLNDLYFFRVCLAYLSRIPTQMSDRTDSTPGQPQEHYLRSLLHRINSILRRERPDRCFGWRSFRCARGNRRTIQHRGLLCHWSLGLL